MHESVNNAGNMFPTYCKSNAKLSKSDAYTAHLTTSLLFTCLISFGRCLSSDMKFMKELKDIFKTQQSSIYEKMSKCVVGKLLLY